MDVCLELRFNNDQIIEIAGEDELIIYNEELEINDKINGYELQELQTKEYKVHKLLDHLLKNEYIGIKINEIENSFEFGERSIDSKSNELLVKTTFINSLYFID